MNYIVIRIPAESRVLLLEDSPMRIAWFSKRIPHLTVTRTVKEFKDYFDTKPLVDFIFFDHDLGDGGTGYEAAEFIQERFGGNTTNAGLIHTWNPGGADRMRKLLPLTRWIPFGEFEVEVESTDTGLHASTGSDSAHSADPSAQSTQRSTAQLDRPTAAQESRRE